jgi:membrane fusion protein, heavy metal efflux system
VVELQPREAAMKTAQAEAREARNRLELLGVPRLEIERLDREDMIKAEVLQRAPFDGRVIMRNITRGKVVETQQKLFTVADLAATLFNKSDIAGARSGLAPLTMKSLRPKTVNRL